MSLTGGVVGFDFGTSCCVISQAKRGGIDTVLNENSKRQTASLVSFQGKQRFVGEAAVPLQKSNFKNTICNFKGLLGLDFDSPEAQREISRMPNKNSFVKLQNNAVGVKVSFNDQEVVFSMEQITAMLLNRLRATVQQSKTHDLTTDVVVSVPGFWTAKQRQALIDSCKIAGFVPLRLLNNHTATALSYGIYKSARNVFDSSNPENVMFVDIGYATTSICIASFVQGKLEVKAEVHSSNLGGRDLDYILYEKFRKEFLQKHNLDIETSEKAKLKMLDACQKAKQTLTPDGVNLAKITVEFLMDEIDFKSEITFDELTAESSQLLSELEGMIRKCVEESNLTYESVNFVEIIGGGTRPRMIKKCIAEAMKLDLSKHNYGLSTTLNLDEAVSRGCALNSAMLSPQFRVKEFNVFDSVYYPVKLTWEQKMAIENFQSLTESQNENDSTAPPQSHNEKEENSNSVLILRERDLYPVSKRVTFRRNQDFEIKASYEVAGWKSKLPIVDSHLATFKITLPKKSAADDEKLQIRVDFRQNLNGIFEITSAASLKEVSVAAEETSSEAPKNSVDEAKEQKSEGEAKDKKEEEKVAEQKGDAEKPKAKKKSFVRTVLDVKSEYNYGLENKSLQNFVDAEKQMVKVDRIIEETAEAKNSLETFIYNYRDKIDSVLTEFTSEAERVAFKTQLEENETWLYDDGFDVEKEKYVQRLNNLKQYGDRYDIRLNEDQNRPSEISSLAAILEEIKEKLQTNETIEAKDRKKVLDMLSENEEWLRNQLAGQGALRKSDDPVLTSDMVRDVKEKMVKVCLPIVNKVVKKEDPKKSSETESKMEQEEANGQANGEGKDQEKKSDNKPEVDMDVD